MLDDEESIGLEYHYERRLEQLGEQLRRREQEVQYLSNRLDRATKFLDRALLHCLGRGLNDEIRLFLNGGK